MHCGAFDVSTENAWTADWTTEEHLDFAIKRCKDVGGGTITFAEMPQ